LIFSAFFVVLLISQDHKLNVLPSYDGWNLSQPLYDPPGFTGELPKFEGYGLKIYTGSCHCGAVTLAVKTKPFPDVEVKEDNCSICQRVSLHFLAPSPNIHHDQLPLLNLVLFFLSIYYDEYYIFQVANKLVI
jgi:hypothetical protein